MNILIFSYYDGRSKDSKSFKEIAELTKPSKEEYCKKFGYDFLSEEVIETDREIGWRKIDVFRERLISGYYDWIVYVEADAMICNLTIPLTDILDDKYDMIIAKNSISKGWDGINCGVMAIKNSQWSLDFLYKIDSKENFWNHPWQEQAAIIDEIENNPEVLKNIKIEKCSIINAFHHVWYNFDDFKFGDFILHDAGASNEHRFKLFTEMKDKIIKNKYTDYSNWKIETERFL